MVISTRQQITRHGRPQAATKEITDKYAELVKKYQGMPLNDGTNLGSGDGSTSGNGSTVENDAVVDEKNKITPTTNKEAPWLKEEWYKGLYQSANFWCFLYLCRKGY